jgi:flavin reductase (DIM6/NTAB) family NADH-FMN oxidoreductase RutF
MKKFLKKILLGITLPQEYLCVNLNDFGKPLKLVVNNGKSNHSKDLTEHHQFVGYKPLIIAIDGKYLNEKNLNSAGTLTLSLLSDGTGELAYLRVKLIRTVKLNSTECLLFEGIHGKHLFDNPLRKFFNALLYNLTADRKKNVFLAGNLYEQIKIAYSIPRRIYLTSVGSNGLFNIFPTDISGKFDEDYFIVSLRSKGKANAQIEKEGKCLIAIMNADSFNEVYKAGKNHMRGLSKAAELGIGLRNESSVIFSLPVPLGTVQYFELDKIDKFEVGIHSIHFFRIVNSVMLSDKSSVLAHIHRDYAEWRLRNNITTNYLVRK